MADTMQFDLVSPERKLASVQATEVKIPGAEGDLTAMPSHSPMITTLRPGILEVVSAEGSTSYAVTGGFAEITAEGASILAEKALAVEDMTQELLQELLAEAEAAKEAATPETADAAAKRVADVAAMGAQIGLSA